MGVLPVTPGLLLGAVLAVLALAGPVDGASGPHPQLADIEDNTAVDLGPYTCRAPEDEPHGCETITDYSRFVYDRFNHQLLMFGGGHAATHRTDVDVFDLSTLGWASAYPSTPCSEMRLANRGPSAEWRSTGHPIARHTYDMLVIPDSTRRLLLLSSTTGQGHCIEKPGPDQDPYFLTGKIGIYDPVDRTWSYSTASTGGWLPYAAAEYDPGSGRVVVIDYSSLWTYDPVKQTTTRHLSYSNEALSYGKNLVYFPPNQKMYYIVDGGTIFEIDLSRSSFGWTSMRRVTGIKGDVPKLPETGFAYDSVNRIIGGGVRDGVFYAYDPLGRAWTARRMRAVPADRPIGSVAFHALDYDPVNNVFFFISDHESGRRTWAYRYGGQPAAASRPAPVTAPRK
jgi:hypothetical protein